MLHFEVQPKAAGIVTSFNSPAQRERREREERYKAMKNRRKTERRQADLISVSWDQRIQKAVGCVLFCFFLGGRVSV